MVLWRRQQLGCSATTSHGVGPQETRFKARAAQSSTVLLKKKKKVLQQSTKPDLTLRELLLH